MFKLHPALSHPKVKRMNLHSSLRDIILGGQDGLVNVLGLTLGLVAAHSSNKIILIAGLASGFSEAISMGAVAYTSSLAQRDFYLKLEKNTIEEIVANPQVKKEMLLNLYKEKGFNEIDCYLIFSNVFQDTKLFATTILTDYYKVYPLEMKGVIFSSFIVGISSLVGAFPPLLSYLFLPIFSATFIAIFLSAVILFIVGVYKAVTLVGVWWKAGFQMLFIGILSAFAGFFIGLILNMH